MKKILFWILGIVFVLVMIIAGAFIFSGGKSVTPTATGNFAVNTFPVSNTSPVTVTQPNKTMTVPTQSGSKITTPDFIHNGVTIEDPANPGTYYLAGNSGACKPDGTCPTAGTQTDFTILYYPSSGAFNIGLATEPIGAVRVEAEQYLMKELGLTQNQMCSLNYYIGTTSYVNQQYGGENLGFSFCPGAVQLPQ